MQDFDLFENAPCGYIILHLKDGITLANKAFLELTGLTGDQARGLSFRQLLTSAGALFFDTQVLPALLLSGKRYEVALDLRVGSERIPVIANFAVVQEADVPVYLRVVLVDARERRLFEKDLLRSRKEAEQLSEVILHSSDAIITMQVDGTVRNWNTGASEMFGFPPHEAIGRQLPDLIAFKSTPDQFNDALKNLNLGREFSWETVSQRKDGAAIDVSIKLTPHMEAPGTLVAFSAIIRDITRLKIAERAVLQTEKLASVGRLASSISHEINNPLAAVTNLLYLIGLQANTPELKQLTETAQDELSRVSQITTHTLRFHRQSTRPVTVSLHSLFESVVVLFRARLRNSRIVTNIEGGDVSLFCHDGELRQVLLNIVSNSIDAMKHGGSITIRCRKIQGSKLTSPGVRITIADTGTGMDASTLARIYEPFFTTKGIGGTGLGLWVTQDLVRKNGGEMRVRSSVHSCHHGTAFTLFFRQAA
jgi:PAS domain S-box-containing protein